MLLIVGGSVEDWGIISNFLDEGDPRSAKEQFNAHYGWSPFHGFTLDPVTFTLTYPEDPPLEPLSVMLFRGETIVLYPHAWVLVMQPDNSWEICRMD